MNGYSKMKVIDTTNSRSMDFSDLLSLSQTQNSTSKTAQNSKTKLQEPNDQIKKPPTEELEEEEEVEDHHHQEECNVGDKFAAGGVNKLSRTSSVSSASAVHSALKRVLSMKRSSSVSERYRRIHDQSVTFSSSPFDDEDGVEMERTRSVMKKKHGKSKILKACKKLFGL